MPNILECSLMSHASCNLPEGPEPTAARAAPQGTASTADAEGSGASYECVNDCVSSLGVTTLVTGALTSLGCAAFPPACPIFIGTALGSTLAACESACEDLESMP